MAEQTHIANAIKNIEADHAREPHDANPTVLLRLRQAQDLITKRDADQAAVKAAAAAKAATKP